MKCCVCNKNNKVLGKALPSDILRETYVNLERDLERYRQQAGYDAFFYREARRDSVSDEKTEEKADEKSKKEPSNSSEDGLNRAQTRQIYFTMGLITIGILILIALVAFGKLDIVDFVKGLLQKWLE